MRHDRELIRGYAVDIYQATWQRPQSFGALKGWALVWLLLVLHIVIIALFKGRLGVLIVSGIAWLFGHALLVALTQWDVDWDRLCLRWLLTLSRCARQYYR